VTRLARAVIASALVLAFGVMPLAANLCAISCEAAHSSAAGAKPTCHHTGSSVPRIGHVPQPCGHDHHPILVDAIATAAATSKIIVLLPLLTSDLAGSLPREGAMISRAGPAFGPSRAALPLALSSALRI